MLDTMRRRRQELGRESPDRSPGPELRRLLGHPGRVPRLSIRRPRERRRSGNFRVRNSTRQFQEALRTYSRQTGQSITPDIARANRPRPPGLDGSRPRRGPRCRKRQAQACRSGCPARRHHRTRSRLFKGSDGKFDPELFRSILRSNNLTEAEYVASERNRFLRTAVSDSASESFRRPQPLSRRPIAFAMRSAMRVSSWSRRPTPRLPRRPTTN